MMRNFIIQRHSEHSNNLEMKQNILCQQSFDTHVVMLCVMLACAGWNV